MALVFNNTTGVYNLYTYYKNKKYSTISVS